MKSCLAVIQGKNFLLSALIAFISIWCLGPYLAIAGKMPFGSFLTRVITSFLVILGLLAFEYGKQFTFFSKDLPLPAEVENELTNLHIGLKNVLRVLFSNKIKSFLFKYRKPWYLVLGPTASGKTTLLQKADLNLKGLDNLPPMTITPTKYVNWWLGDDAIFIDMGGRYFKNQEETVSLLLSRFFQLLRRYRKFHPINGLILTVNLQELIINLRDQVQIKNLREAIDELTKQFKHFPIYLIITRCDTIEGFAEFFEDLGPEERNQIFGMSFPLEADAGSLPELFNEEYQALLTRLNQRIIWRLNKEHHLEKIGKIKNFPLQIEFLKNPLAKLLTLILPPASCQLRGIYFTSAFQKETPFNNLTKTLATAYDVHHTHSGFRLAPAKDFFIKQIFKRIIFQETSYFSTHQQPGKINFFTSLTLLVLTTCCFFILCSSYQFNLKTLQIATHVLQQGRLSHANTNPNGELDRLQTVLNNLAYKNQGAWYQQFPLFQTQQLQRKASIIYDKQLKTQFLDYLQRTLEIQLQNIQTEEVTQVYAALKAYLMLADHHHLDKKFLQNWFDNYWHQLSIDRSQLKKLNQHFSALLKNDLPSIELNTQLIDSKRLTLNSIPPAKLVLILLENHFQGSPIKILSEFHGNNLNHLPSEISGIYSILNFKQIYYHEIDKTCQEISKGDWVLGIVSQPGFSDIFLTQLSSEVKMLYLNEYASTWSNILSKIKAEEFQSLDQIAEMLDLLSNPKSPLLQLVHTIKNNTAPLSDSVEFSQQVSRHFLTLNLISADRLQNTNHAALLGVKTYIHKIIHSSDPNRAAYEAAKVRMENHYDALTLLLQQSHFLPEPLQSWHTTIAAESWRLILKQAQNYLNQIWVTTVYPQYVLLDQRYPLFKEASTDITLTDFATFFGNGGAMDTFFKTYLEPFIDSSELYWQWRNVEGQRINIPQATLEMFIRAALIQKMFFSNNTKFPAISFSLVPVELPTHVQSFSLNLDGQLLQFQKDNEQIISLTWPGPSPNQAEITFLDNQGRRSTLSQTGPWAWFRILDKSLLQSTSSSKHFKLSFRLNDNVAQYELYTNGIVNPFISGILNTFRCPENLF